MKPTASPARWPYLEHRTLAQVFAKDFNDEQALLHLDWISRQRALTEEESRRLERLLARAA